MVLLQFFSVVGIGQTTLLVPAQYPAIQGAINAAFTGDTVLVSPGTYFENIDFLGKAITVTSVQGAETTIIDGGQIDRVVLFANGESAQSVLEGFTVTNGAATTPVPPNGTLEGGGILCEGTEPTIRGCRIIGNQTLPVLFYGPFGFGFSGGGIACIDAAPLIESCIIEGNQASDSPGDDGPGSPGGGGGGIYVYASSMVGSVIIRGCIIRGNTTGDGGSGAWGSGSGGHGGGILVQAFGWTAVVVESTIIHGNSCGDGGGVPAEQPFGPGGPGGGGGGVAGSGIVLVNCTLWGNATGSSIASPWWLGGNGPSGGGGISGPSMTQAHNCIIWGNSPDQVSGSVIVSNSAVEGGPPWSSLPIADPGLVDPTNGDFHLTPVSPCIDQGEGSLFPLPPDDFEGDPRVVCGAVDIGADEFVNAPPSGEWFVSASWPGPGCGSQSVPFRFIQAAIDAANYGDVITVAPGIYVEAADLDFNGKAVVVRSSHGPAQTTVMGTGTGPAVTFASQETAASVLHGFTVMGGVASAGGGIICAGSSPKISRCILKMNQAVGPGGLGGGIACINASPLITNCLIVDNSASAYGSGIGCDSGSSPQISNCTLSANTGPALGLSIAAAGGSTPTVTYSILWDGSTPVNQVFEETSGPNPSTVCFFSSTIPGGWSGCGDSNSADDPLFVNPPAGVYALTSNQQVQSPAIDPVNAGPIPALGLETVDLDGKFRINQVLDKGAYEHHAVCGPPPFDACVPGGVGNGSLLHRFPGSQEGFNMFTLLDGAGDPFSDDKAASGGELLTVFLYASSGGFAASPSALAAQLFATGTTVLTPPALSEVHLDPANAIVILDATLVPALGPGGFTLNLTIPPGLGGFIARLQGFCFSPAAANQFFASTSAYEVRFVPPSLP